MRDERHGVQREGHEAEGELDLRFFRRGCRRFRPPFLADIVVEPLRCFRRALFLLYRGSTMFRDMGGVAIVWMTRMVILRRVPGRKRPDRSFIRPAGALVIFPLRRSTGGGYVPDAELYRLRAAAATTREVRRCGEERRLAQNGGWGRSASEEVREYVRDGVLPVRRLRQCTTDSLVLGSRVGVVGRGCRLFGVPTQTDNILRL